MAKQALAAYRLGQYEKAIKSYKRAYRLLPEPRYLYALGLSYRKLGRPGPALLYLEWFVRETRDPAGSTLRRRAAKHIAEIKRTTSLVTLDVRPAGARVLVEGQAAMTAPIKKKLRLRNGEHRLMAMLAGYGSVQRRFQVGPGLANRVVVRLRPWGRPRAEPARRRVEPARRRVEPARRRVEPARRTREVPGPGTGRDAGPEAGSRVFRAVGWSGVALASVSVVVAAALGGLAAQAKRRVEDAAQDQMWEPDLAEDYANVGRFQTGAWVAGGIGAALLVTGVVLLALDGRRQRERRVWLQPAVGPGRVGLGLGFQY